MDITLPAGTAFQQSLPPQHTAFIYVIDGDLELVDASVESAAAGTQELSRKMLGILGPGDQLSLVSKDAGSRFLLVAGQPLHEPVARGGPFVMNTREQLVQAYADFSSGQF
jgi:hypothetical protein